MRCAQDRVGGRAPVPLERGTVERADRDELGLTLMVERARAASRWAAWASEEVERWADTTTPNVDRAVQAMRRVIEGEPASDAP
jgi:hypothetical protein